MTSNQADRSRDVSAALTEVRTVLSRAESAIDRIERMPAYRDRYPEYADCLDPDEGRMLGALNEVVALLDEWRRAGRPRRG